MEVLLLVNVCSWVWWCNAQVMPCLCGIESSLGIAMSSECNSTSSQRNQQSSFPEAAEQTPGSSRWAQPRSIRLAKWPQAMDEVWSQGGHSRQWMRRGPRECNAAVTSTSTDGRALGWDGESWKRLPGHKWPSNWFLWNSRAEHNPSHVHFRPLSSVLHICPTELEENKCGLKATVTICYAHFIQVFKKQCNHSEAKESIIPCLILETKDIVLQEENEIMKHSQSVPAGDILETESTEDKKCGQWTYVAFFLSVFPKE